MEELAAVLLVMVLVVGIVIAPIVTLILCIGLRRRQKRLSRSWCCRPQPGQ